MNPDSAIALRHRALVAAPRAEVVALAARLAGRHEVRPHALPQEGLVLLTLEDGVFRDHFHLGELAVATAEVEVAGVRGGACLVGGDREWAEAAAVCDAVVAGRLAGVDEVEQLLATGWDKIGQTASERAAMRAATRVRFAELGEEPPC